MENPDDTFATTLSGADAQRLERLRRSYGREAESDADWESWRRVVLQSLRSGKSVENRVAALEKQVGGFAKESAHTRLDTRVLRLEEEAGRRRGLWGQVLKALGAIGLVVLGHELSRWIK